MKTLISYPKSEQQDEINSLFQLTLILHHLNKDVERKFRLSLIQLFVLLKLRQLPATSAQVLARAVGVHPSSLSQTLRRLTRKEFIFVTKDPKDNRKILIALTKRGRDTIDIVYKELKGVFLGVRSACKTENAVGMSLDYLKSVRQRLLAEFVGR